MFRLSKVDADARLRVSPATINRMIGGGSVGGRIAR